MLSARPTEWVISARGTTQLRRGPEPVALRPKERAVLAAIAITHPQRIDTAMIASLVWGAAPPASAHKSVQNHIARIRRVATDVIATSHDGYGLGDGVHIDFGTVDDVGKVLFADLPANPEVSGHRQRVQSVVSSIDEAELEAAVRDGVDARLIERLHAAVLDEPYNEQRWWLLTSAQGRLGRRRDALLSYEAARQHLAEVGLEPGARLRTLADQILEDRPDADGPPDRPTTPPSADRAARHQQLHQHHDDPFVGRASELATLVRIWSEVVEHRQPQLVLIEGPAGMGKTRLADQFCGTAPEHRRVVWGRNRGTTDRPFGAIAEAVSRVLDEEPELIGRLGVRLSGLWSLVPHHTPTDQQIRANDEPLRRSHLGNAISALTRELATEPTVWFIDDLQWATTDSIALVVEAFDGLTGPVMLIATRRPTGIDNADGLASLVRLLPTTRIDLGELTVADVAELCRTGGAPVSSDDAALVHARTAGLPLYASEIARHARLTGDRVDPATIPTAIREWVTHHVDGLDPISGEVLRLAAVIGHKVDPWLITDCLPHTDAETVADHCDTLVQRGLLGVRASTPHESLTLRFSHAITRDIVYAQIGPMAQAGLHRRVGVALEQNTGAIDHRVLVHHFAHAGPQYRTRVEHHARIAGRQSIEVGAWDTAIDLFTVAIDAAATPSARANTLVDLGRAQLRSDAFEDAVASLQEAVVIARAEGLASVQAAATLELVGRAGRGAAVGHGDAAHIDLLREAIDRLSGGDQSGDRSADRSDEQAILLSDLERELAYSLLLTDAVQERDELLTRSLERVRPIGSRRPDAVATALLGARYSKLDPAHIRSRLADIDEVLAMPSVRLGPEILLATHCYRHEDLLRTGDLARAERALDDAEIIVRGYPHPYWAWTCHTWRVLEQVIGGNFDRAERLAFESFELRPAIAEAEACLSVNLVNIRLYQQRTAEMIEPLLAAVDRHPEIPTYRAVMALCASEAGDHDLARRSLDWFADDGFARLPADTNRFLGLAVLAHVAADLGDGDAARSLSTLLEPYRDQWVVLSCYGGGGASWGPVNHALARLAVLDDRESDAQFLFASATEQAAGSPPALARIAGDRAAASISIG